MLTTSVIVPTFNRDRYLKECLDSLLGQTLPPAEVIVVDDGSTDETPALLESYDGMVRYVRKRNTGKAASLNMALPQTSQPLVWIVDDDDVVCPDALERMTRLLEKDPRAGFTYGPHERFVQDESGERTLLGTGYWRDCAPSEFLVATLEDFFAHQPGMLVRRGLYQEVGPFDESLARSQDYEMLIRLARAGRGARADEVVFLQRQHEGGRGPAGQRFRAAEADDKWIDADKRIFAAVRDELDLGEYLPGAPGGALGPAERRRALLARGVVMARKKLWHLAVEDFREAERQGLGPLDPDDTGILRRTFSSKFGCSEVATDAGVATALVSIPADTVDGRAIRQALAAGLRWRVKQAARAGQVSEAKQYLALAGRLWFGLGPRGG